MRPLYRKIQKKQAKKVFGVNPSCRKVSAILPAKVFAYLVCALTRCRSLLLFQAAEAEGASGTAGAVRPSAVRQTAPAVDAVRGARRARAQKFQKRFKNRETRCFALQFSTWERKTGHFPWNFPGEQRRQTFRCFYFCI